MAVGRLTVWTAEETASIVARFFDKTYSNLEIRRTGFCLATQQRD
jgi:hypothetical protein